MSGPERVEARPRRSASSRRRSRSGAASASGAPRGAPRPSGPRAPGARRRARRPAAARAGRRPLGPPAPGPRRPPSRGRRRSSRSRPLAETPRLATSRTTSSALSRPRASRWPGAACAGRAAGRGGSPRPGDPLQLAAGPLGSPRTSSSSQRTRGMWRHPGRSAAAGIRSTRASAASASSRRPSAQEGPGEVAGRAHLGSRAATCRAPRRRPARASARPPRGVPLRTPPRAPWRRASRCDLLVEPARRVHHVVAIAATARCRPAAGRRRTRRRAPAGTRVAPHWAGARILPRALAVARAAELARSASAAPSRTRFSSQISTDASSASAESASWAGAGRPSHAPRNARASGPRPSTNADQPADSVRPAPQAVARVLVREPRPEVERERVIAAAGRDGPRTPRSSERRRLAAGLGGDRGELANPFLAQEPCPRRPAIRSARSSDGSPAARRCASAARRQVGSSPASRSMASASRRCSRRRASSVTPPVPPRG